MKKSSFPLTAFPLLFLSALVIASCGGGGGGGGAPVGGGGDVSGVSSQAFTAAYGAAAFVVPNADPADPADPEAPDDVVVDAGDARPEGVQLTIPFFQNSIPEGSDTAPTPLASDATAAEEEAYSIALGKYEVAQARFTCPAINSLCEIYHNLEIQARDDDSASGRFIPGLQEFTALTSLSTDIDGRTTEPIFLLTDLSLVSNLPDEVVETDDFIELFSSRIHTDSRILMEHILGPQASLITTVHCFQVTGNACSDAVNTNDVLQIIIPDLPSGAVNRNVEPEGDSAPVIVIPAAAMAFYRATVTAASGRVVFVAPLALGETDSDFCNVDVPTGAYCIGAPGGFYFFSQTYDDHDFFSSGQNMGGDDRVYYGYNEEGPDAHHAAATIITSYMALVKKAHTAINPTQLASLFNHCANVYQANPDVPVEDDIIDFNCLLNADKSDFLRTLAEVPGFTASARPVSSLGAFPSFGFSVQALPYTDEFGRDFPIPVSYSYSDGSQAPLTSPASSILSPMNSNKPQTLALHDKNAFVHAVKIPLGSQCLLAAAAAVEHSSFNGSSSSSDAFSLGDSLTPFIGASCSKNPRKNLSLTAWAAQRSPMLVNPDPSSLIQSVSGQETILGVQASLLAPLNSQITLSLRHGSGVRGEALVAGQTLALHPQSWSAASLSLHLPFLKRFSL